MSEVWNRKWKKLHIAWHLAQLNLIPICYSWYNLDKPVPISWKDLPDLRLQKLLLLWELLIPQEHILDEIKIQLQLWYKSIELAVRSPIPHCQIQYLLKSKVYYTKIQ